MFASGVQGWPVAGWAQMRTVAPARGTPRELKTISSLRVPCACTGASAPGTRCSASVSHAQKIAIVVARGKRAAILDRIIGLFDPFLRDMRFEEYFADVFRASVSFCCLRYANPIAIRADHAAGVPARSGKSREQ